MSVHKSFRKTACQTNTVRMRQFTQIQGVVQITHGRILIGRKRAQIQRGRSILRRHFTMFRIFSLTLAMLAAASSAMANEAKDVGLRHPARQTRKPIKTSSLRPHSPSAPVISSRTKTETVNAQLSKIESAAVKSEVQNKRPTGSLVLHKRDTTKSSIQSLNFPYHPPKTTMQTQSAGAGRGVAKAGGVHRTR